MAQTVAELKKENDSLDTGTLIANAISIDGSKVKTGVKDSMLLVKIVSEKKPEQSTTLSSIKAILAKTHPSTIDTCRIGAYPTNGSEAFWVVNIALQEEEAKEPNKHIDGRLSVKQEDIPQGKRGSRWKIPGVNISSLQQVKTQVSEQAVQMAKNTASSTHGLASKATEQALRSSIDQTMNAFQIAIEQIHERKIPAEKTALTGTINVGVVQLSIRVDIPMTEKMGDFEIEIGE